ncbi:MAG: sigma-70 family RNA polymerase sigma factor [Muribaculaceae bacterium]|nr:sigma-70 family RNA polymerase sigma factor [Muribaculaceae bacterium]
MEAREFQNIYKKSYMPLCMYALRLTENTDVANDVVQFSFMRVWELLQEGREIHNLPVYLYRVVRNVALSQMKTDRLYIPLPDNSEEIEVTDEDIDTSQRDARLWSAIDSMPPRRREIFLLSKRDGLTYAAIADELGLSVKTVENQMSKALATLRNETSLLNSSFIFTFL